MARALRDAGFTALLAFGLFLPLIGFQTITDFRNNLVLNTRWPLLFAHRRHRRRRTAGLIRWSSSRGSSSARCGRSRRRRRPGARMSRKWFVPFAIGFVIVYPAIWSLPSTASAAR